MACTLGSREMPVSLFFECGALAFYVCVQSEYACTRTHVHVTLAGIDVVHRFIPLFRVPVCLLLQEQEQPSCHQRLA